MAWRGGSKMCFAAKKIKGFVTGGDNELVLRVVGRGLGSTEEQDPGEAGSLGFLAQRRVPAAGSVLWLPKGSQGLLSVPSGILWTVRKHRGTHNRLFPLELPALSKDPREMTAAPVGAGHGEPAAPLAGLGATRRCGQRQGRRKSAAVIGHVGKCLLSACLFHCVLPQRLCQMRVTLRWEWGKPPRVKIAAVCSGGLVSPPCFRPFFLVLP